MENKNKKYITENTTITIGDHGFSKGVMWGEPNKSSTDGRFGRYHKPNYVFFNPDKSNHFTSSDCDMRVPLEVIIDEWLESLSPERQREFELLETKRKEEVELKKQIVKEEFEKSWEDRINPF